MKRLLPVILALAVLPIVACSIFTSKLSAPVPVQPIDNQKVGSHPTFIWLEVEDAAGYTLEVAHNQDMDSVIVTEETTDTSYSVQTALDTGTYYWRVAATDEKERPGEYSTVESFTVIQGGNGQFPRQVGLLEFLSNYSPYECMVSGDVAYLTAKGAGLVSINVANPSSPYELDRYEIPEQEVWFVYVNGNTAYTGLRTDGIAILDVTDPSQMELVNQTDPGYDCKGLWVENNYLYLAANIGTKGVFAVYNLTTDAFVYADTADDSFEEIAVAGDYAYLVGGESAGYVKVYDISSPASPQVIGEYVSELIDGEAKNVAVAGDRAYLANYNAGLEILNITSPSMMERIGLYQPSDPVYDVKVSGDTAYVADGWGGLKVVDISAPTDPVLMSEIIPEHTSLLGLDMVGNYLYCADNGNKAFFIVALR